MAERELVGKGSKEIVNTPIISYRDAKPGQFVGKLLGVKRDVGDNHKNVYTFAAVDGDLPTMVKIGKDFVPVDIAEGDKVEIWGCTVLDDRMDGAQIGETVRIVYDGRGKKAPGRQAPYMFSVYVVE